jgi:hypothetical protein
MAASIAWKPIAFKTGGSPSATRSAAGIPAELLRQLSTTETTDPPELLLPGKDFLTNGAEGGTRTPMVLRPSAPQAGASANFATSAETGTLGTRLRLQRCPNAIETAPDSAPREFWPEPLRAPWELLRWNAATPNSSALLLTRHSG